MMEKIYQVNMNKQEAGGQKACTHEAQGSKEWLTIAKKIQFIPTQKRWWPLFQIICYIRSVFFK